jgi:ABC-type Na+ efflux pump permease subunit
MAVTTVLPNSWWLVRNWRNLDGDLFGATTQVEYQYSLGLPYATDEVFLFKASETGHSSIPEMILKTDWLLRFNTRLWLSERYNDGSGLGIFLAAVFVAVTVAALVIAIRGAARSPDKVLQPAQQFVPLALLVVFLIAAVMTANNNYTHGLYVIGRYAMPPVALLMAATVAMASRLDSPLGRYAAPAVAIGMFAVHIAFWAGFMLPDLLRQMGPA